MKTKGNLNREAITADEKTYEVMVTAVDPFGETDMAPVTIEIENEDESPAINERNAKTMLEYAEPVGATAIDPLPVLLWTYMAEDDEDDANDEALEWKLEGADRSKLTIVEMDGNGELKFLENPDFEKPADANKNNVYEVTVVVTDSGRLTDTLAVRVEVTNFEEAGEVTFTVGTPRVGVPLTAMLEDPDGDETGHEWQWMVADDENDDATAIDGATAATFTPRDGDVGKVLSVEVKYTDGKGKDEVTQRLTTAVAASAAPRFYDKVASDTTKKVVSEFELELAENTGTFDPSDDKKDGDIFVGHRTDDPETVLKYAVGGADAASFKVITDSSAGTVKLQAQVPLDIEEKGSYAVTVTATDSDGNTATLAVTVSVTNADEMPDVSGSGAGCEEKTDKTGYECEYAENGTGPVATFTATDPEGAAVRWDLSGADQIAFSISKDGVLSFNSSPDFEAPGDADEANEYMVTVTATDNAYSIDDAAGVGAVVGVPTPKTVMVEVTNEEEAGKVTLTVNGTPGQPVLQPQMGEELTATLSDGDTATDITWQWYRGSTKIIGETESAYTPAESDISSRLTAKAAYTDGEDANNKKMAEATTTRSVRREPGTNNAPEFPDQTPDAPDTEVKGQDRKVAENTPAGRNIGAPVRANDEGDVLAYSLGGDNAALFDIDIATGQLKTKGNLNREAITADEKTYEVMVTAVDPFGETDMAPVTIEIENEDESPAINERNAKTMLEYAEPVGATAIDPLPVLLWTYMAEDDEDDANDEALEWKLEGADRSKLTIGETDGMLKFLENPDFEKPADANKNNVYEVTVVVTDSGRLTDTLAVRVEVTNFEEAGEVTFTVGTPRVGVPLTAMLEDPDGDETGHEWQWMVADDENDDATAIDGATAATFTPRDGDVGKVLSVEVKYTDGKGKDEVTQRLTTAVAASAAPRFYDKVASDTTRKVVSEFELELAENTGTFDPSDDKKDGDIFVGHRTDDPETVLKYAVGGADAASFKVITDSSAGTVKLQAQVPLDIEEKGSYAVTVTATDSDGNTATLAVTVSVTNVDEAPEIVVGGLALSGPGSLNYAENGIDAVGTYTASGPDAAGARIWLTGDDDGDFNINGEELTFRSSPDFENPADTDGDNVYSVTVNANDGTNDASTDVTVTVTNVDELGTLTGNPSISYRENRMDAVGTYTASGPDADMANWSLEGDDAGVFSINNNGMLTFRSSPDFENPADADTDNVYEVAVKADAGGEMEMMAVTVTVTNEDEPGTVALSMMRPLVGTELTASLDDPDEGVTDTTWQWAGSLDGMDGTWTDIEGAMNAAYTPVDADDTMFLQATASYTDGEGSGKSAMMATANAVTSNSPPAFPETEDGMRSVAENTAAGEAIGDPVMASDADNDTLTYSLGGTDMASFDIDATGQITVGAGTMLDAEGTQTTYMVIVTASDGVASDSIDVTITVENAPLAGIGDEYDANNDEMIQKTEAIAAVRAYFAPGSTLTKEDVIAVIRLYFVNPS